MAAFTTGQVVTAADLNAIVGPAVTYGTAATVWSASGSNPAIGNGTFVSQYRQDNKWVDLFIQITMGSTTTFGSGTWVLALPVTARRSGWGIIGRAIDASVSTTIGYNVTGDVGTTAINLRVDPTTAGSQSRVMSSSNPFTWATGDVLTVTCRYEAA